MALSDQPAVNRARLRSRLIADEGLKLSAYQDHLGYWTIGVGRLIDARKGGGITQDEAHYLLDHDIDRCVREVAAALPWVADLDPVRQAVLVMLAFQLGTGSAVKRTGLMGFKRTLKAIREGQYDDAAVYLLESLLAQQTPARTRRHAEMLRTGEWP